MTGQELHAKTGEDWDALTAEEQASYDLLAEMLSAEGADEPDVPDAG